MPVNSTHQEYDAHLAAWLRARDVLAGEDAVKRAGEKYLPRLETQTDEDFASYVMRACFFNGTARTADGYVGLISRRAPFVKLPTESSAVGKALATFAHDVDMLGTSLPAYAKNVVTEVIGVGRVGSLIDWEGDFENRAFVTMYPAEFILNWRVERLNGRNVPTLIVLQETIESPKPEGPDADIFVSKPIEQIRVLKLVAGDEDTSTKKRSYACQVEIWRRTEKKTRREKTEWQMVETRTPLRRGKPLPLLPFVFHGPRHSLPSVEKIPIADVISLNLDHYRLNADYKHGIHYTALPTAWVSGFDKGSTLPIGSKTAWVTDTPGATAGFLEFKGQGLSTFEKSLDRDEREMAVLGSRLLAEQKRVGETADALEIRQSGENSILGNIATSVSQSLTQILQWVYWWNSTEEIPDAVPESEVIITLNTDYSIKGMASDEIIAVVKAWQSGALSTDTMHELFRRGDVLPDGRSNEEEKALIAQSPPPASEMKNRRNGDTANPSTRQPSTMN
ncbi:MAG: DUF4055 domain-containing protein [Verrucomicrobia bacterium]|nr:DUF4055 domain-containing protein [Verrucomicrobiota bacterium]